MSPMDVGTALRAARERAGLTQAALAHLAGTSQSTVAAYESGRKRPSVDTLSRLLAATGSRLTVEVARQEAVHPSPAQHRRAARALLDVLALAEALPVRHRPELVYPRLTSRAA
jgi:transcriptional regulator with XRE-family HTH domain